MRGQDRIRKERRAFTDRVMCYVYQHFVSVITLFIFEAYFVESKKWKTKKKKSTALVINSINRLTLNSHIAILIYNFNFESGINVFDLIIINSIYDSSGNRKFDICELIRDIQNTYSNVNSMDITI